MGREIEKSISKEEIDDAITVSVHTSQNGKSKQVLTDAMCPFVNFCVHINHHDPSVVNTV